MTMTESAMRLKCRGCGSSVEYSAKDQTTRCPHCGTLTEISKIEEELPDRPALLVPLTIEIEDLTKAVYKHLASGEMTPDELLEHATFTKKERFYTPVYVYDGSFEAQWTALFGYERYEDYTAYEKRTENGNAYTVPVTRTRKVTDWRPVSPDFSSTFGCVSPTNRWWLMVEEQGVRGLLSVTRTVGGRARWHQDPDRELR